MLRPAAILVAMLLSLLSASALAQTASAPQSEKPRVMIVLDASGSMLAPMEGTTRIAVARAALAELLKGWDPEVELGLTVYGHRRKGDCADIETVAAPGKADVARILGLANAIQPKGMTPLSDAVKRAAEALKYTEQRATVILVSDGKETCKADPCAVGRALKQAGVDFRAHVIGFAVTRAEEQGLRCLAETTGGQYFSARNAAGLRRALDAAGRAAQRKDEKKADASRDSSGSAPPAPAADPPATIAGPAKVPAGKSFDVRWTGGHRAGDQIAIVRPGQPDRTIDSAATQDGNPATLTAPERGGAYELRYVSARGTVLARQAIAVEQAAATLEAPATGDAGGTAAIGWTGPDGSDDFVTIVKPDAPESAYTAYAYTRDGAPARLRLPEEPGRYEVRYVTGRENVVLARAPIEIAAARATLEGPAEAPAGSTVDIRFTGPANPGDFVTIVKPSDPDDRYAEFRYAADGSPARLPLRATPGEYEIRYVTGQSNRVLARRKIAATPAKGVVLDAPAEARIGTVIEIAWSGPNDDKDYVTIVKADAAADAYTEYRYTREGSPIRLRVPAEPGRYEIRYNNERDGKVLGRRSLTVVEAAATLEAPATVKAGEEFAVKWTGPGGPTDYVTIVLPDAEAGSYTTYFYMRDANPGRLKAPDKPGRYELRYVIEAGPRVIGRRPIAVE